MTIFSMVQFFERVVVEPVVIGFTLEKVCMYVRHMTGKLGFCKKYFTTIRAETLHCMHCSNMTGQKLETLIIFPHSLQSSAFFACFFVWFLSSYFN